MEQEQENDLVSRFAQEYVAAGTPRFDFNFDPQELMSLIALAQLGLRHPQMATDTTAARAGVLIGKISAAMRNEFPSFSEMIEAGNDSANDIARSEPAAPAVDLLTAVREGATDELIIEIRDALQAAIIEAEGKV